MNHAQQRIDDQHHATLPAGLQRSDVERLLTACAPNLGLSAGLLRCLLVMIQHTRPRDWTSGDCDPICFAAQTTLADTLCLSTRAVRSAERRLEAMGLLTRAVGAGGARGRWGDFSLGLNFAPLVASIEELRRIDMARDAERRRSQVVRHQISAARRLARDTVAALLEASPRHPALPGLLQSFADLPRRYADLSIAALDELLAQVEGIYRSASSNLSGPDLAAARAEQNFRPHIQDTTDENPCSCSDDATIEQTRGKPRDTDLVEAAPAGAVKGCREQPRGSGSANKAHGHERFTAESLYRAASPDFRLYVDAFGGDEAPDALAFIKAATMMRSELGISPSAWEEASEEMGDFTAALSLLVIDARRFDPVRPIRSAGGMLRAFTAHHRAGTLNLCGSLIALIERAKMATLSDATLGPDDAGLTWRRHV